MRLASGTRGQLKVASNGSTHKLTSELPTTPGSPRQVTSSIERSSCRCAISVTTCVMGDNESVVDFSDTSMRMRTRLLCIYDLNNQISAGSNPRPLSDLFRFGRFESHVQSNDRVLPAVLLNIQIDPSQLELAPNLNDLGLSLASCRTAVVVTPYGDPTLILDLLLDGDCNASGVARLLAATCFRRDSITLGEDSLLLRLSERLGVDLRFGRNVHQIVFPGGRLLADVLDAGPGDRETVPQIVKEIVYRSTVAGFSLSRLAIRTPRGLNSQGSTLVAHARGVSLIAGWKEPVENCFGLIAVVLQSSLAVLQRARGHVFETLEMNRRASVGTPAEARALISSLSRSLNDHQLRLVFGVEAYIDSLLIPETIIEGYQVSLYEAMGIGTALQNSSRMMQRLTSVIEARAAALDADQAERDESRERNFSSLVAITTLLALPPALLLAFFGINSTDVDSARSIFDLGRYWPAYLSAWAPFAVLVAVGYRLRRRSARLLIRHRLPRQRKGSGSDGFETARDLGSSGRAGGRS